MEGYWKRGKGWDVQSNLPYPDLQYTGTSLYRAGSIHAHAQIIFTAARIRAETMASKRKRSVMSLEKKLDIIAEVRQGKSQRAVADRFGVAKSTVGDIWKNKEKIETHVTASANPALAKRRCIVRDAHFQKLDEACYLWFQQQRAKGAPVSGPLVQEKALQLFPSLYRDEDES